jgi:hypothetical protein
MLVIFKLEITSMDLGITQMLLVEVTQLTTRVAIGKLVQILIFNLAKQYT